MTMPGASTKHHCPPGCVLDATGIQVYLQQNKKKAEAKGKNCHAKAMWSLEKPK
jgi:hypothetical protein